jgi:hypothetical protein
MSWDVLYSSRGTSQTGGAAGCGVVVVVEVDLILMPEADGNHASFGASGPQEPSRTTTLASAPVADKGGGSTVVAAGSGEVVVSGKPLQRPSPQQQR